MSSLEKTIFKRGSTTYYFSSRFFPKAVREDVFRLYSFVRVADDYVDSVPQNKKEFEILYQRWQDAAEDPAFDTVPDKHDGVNERVIKNMAALSRTYGFEPEWTDAFMASMRADLIGKQYATLDGSLWYVYGSAEVIGFMMAKIMALPAAAMEYAALQGRAMQWINFIRDIAEDTALGRCYFPEEDLKKFGLNDLRQKTAEAHPKEFRNFMNFQLNRYRRWQQEAEEGYGYIPKRLRIPLETAVDSFNWTARQIAANPSCIYEKKIKPRKYRVLQSGIKNLTRKH